MSDELITNGDFAKGSEGWYTNEMDALKAPLKETQLRELAALGQAQEHYEALQTARNDALEEAVHVIDHTTDPDVSDEQMTGRDIFRYECLHAIRSLQTKGG